jgi:Uma2 family endonuclease
MTAVTTLPLRLTYDELQTLPDDGRRYELIDGELYVFAAPSLEHQLLSARLLVHFDSAITLKGLGWVMTAPIEVKFPGDNAVQPDLVVVLRDRAQILAQTRIEGAPNLLLEILSPSNRAYDLTTKAALYARHGVPEFWIVDVEAETITVHELRGGRYVPLPGGEVARSRLVPELAVDVRALFAAARV